MIILTSPYEIMLRWGVVFSSKWMVHIQPLITLLIFSASLFIWYVVFIIYNCFIMKCLKRNQTIFHMIFSLWECIWSPQSKQLDVSKLMLWYYFDKCIKNKVLLQNICIPASWKKLLRLPKKVKKGERHIRLYHGYPTVIHTVWLWEVR